jgi:pimeloyl-ACP methyl ester carboxylesterase
MEAAALGAATLNVQEQPRSVQTGVVMRAERRRKVSTDVRVDRVYDGDMYVRVNSIGDSGTRSFVLVPGIGVSSTYFEKLAPHLNEFGPVHALDLPGFGGVPHPNSTLSIEQYADLVGKVIDELDLDDPIIVGHSMGSQVVSQLVANRTDISTLVLIGPVIVPGQRRVLTQALRFAQAAWHEPLTVKILAVSAYLFCGVKWFSRVLPNMLNFEIEKQLPKITAHTLVIRGEFDAVAPREWLDQIGELIPSARLWEIPGAAHSVMYAHAEAVALLCVEHAREHADPSAESELTVLKGVESTAEEAPSMPEIALAIGGRVTETLGILQDDDEKIEQGKSAAAEAIQDAAGQDGARPDSK